MIDLSLVFGGFGRMKQARSVPESGCFRRRSVFLRTSMSVRDMWWNDPKDITLWSFSNLPISVVSSIGGKTVRLWMLWQMPLKRRTGHAPAPERRTLYNDAAKSLNEGPHTQVRSLGQARRLHHVHGWALGRMSSHSPFFSTVETLVEIC